MNPRDDELAPIIGEAFRDVLAERAIRLLADWDPEPPVLRCERIANADTRDYPKTTRAPQRAALSPFYRMPGGAHERKDP